GVFTVAEPISIRWPVPLLEPGEVAPIAQIQPLSFRSRPTPVVSSRAGVVESDLTDPAGDWDWLELPGLWKGPDNSTLAASGLGPSDLPQRSAAPATAGQPKPTTPPAPVQSKPGSTALPPDRTVAAASTNPNSSSPLPGTNRLAPAGVR